MRQPGELFGLLSVLYHDLCDSASIAEKEEGYVAQLSEMVQPTAELHALRRTFEVLAAHAAAPLVVCCTAGVDRTGMVVALLLSVLGVSDADVAGDYATCDPEWLAARLALMPALLGVPPADLPAADLLPLIAPSRETIPRFLDGIRAEHGSVPDYVAGRLGLGGSGLAVLRSSLVVPGG